jgi:hypothetical protein
MNRILIALILVVQACSTPFKTSEHLERIHSCYNDAILFENSAFCFIKDEHTHIRRQVNIVRGRDFWRAFSAYRQEVGAAKAEETLKGIVQQKGLSIILLTPINDDLRGVEVDRLIDSMLLANYKRTRLLVEQVGAPPDLSFVSRIRESRDL